MNVRVACRQRCILAVVIVTMMFGAIACNVNADDAQRLASFQHREKCLTILREGLVSDEFWPSIHAAEGLTLAGHGDEVRKTLSPKLRAEKDDQRRCGLARELVRAGDWRHVNTLLNILASENPHGHVHAAECLYKLAEIGDGQLLRKAFAQTKNFKLRLLAAAALGRCGNPRAMTWLREQLANHDDVEVKRNTAWILARIGDESDIPQLRQNAAAASDAVLLATHEHALATLGDEAGLRALIKNLDSEKPDVRIYAATFAGDARATAAANQLIGLLDDNVLDVRIRAAQTLLVLSQPAHTTSKFSQIVYAASKENPRYTEGSIIRLRDDSLLFAVTQFAGSYSDFARARIVARRSVDSGHTWTGAKLLQESTGDMNVMSVTLRRLNAPHDDTIAMFYLEKNSVTDLRVFVRHSTDEAQTFGEPICVTADPGYHVMNNDRVVQLSTGRLLAPVASTPDVHKVNHFRSRCYLSDDGGRSWRAGKEHVDLPKRGALEPETIELRDGKVMMILRTQLGYIAKSISDDGGGTWSKPSRLSNLQAPEAPATIRRIPATGDLLLIWNNTFTEGAGHGGKRTPLTAAISSDEGETWQHIRNLETDGAKTFSYTSVTFVKDRALLSYWEESNRSYSSRFQSLPVSWLYEID